MLPSGVLAAVPPLGDSLRALGYLCESHLKQRVVVGEATLLANRAHTERVFPRLGAQETSDSDKRVTGHCHSFKIERASEATDSPQIPVPCLPSRKLQRWTRITVVKGSSQRQITFMGVDSAADKQTTALSTPMNAFWRCEPP